MDQRHKISLWTAILLNANVMIGAGIFAYPQEMAVGAGSASFLAWPIIALIFLPIVISVSTLARIFPGAGSFYTYSRKIINPTAGFMSSWAFYLAYTIITALLTILLRDKVLLPALGINPIAFNIVFITAIALLSLLNLQTVGRIQNTAVFFKFFPLLFVIAVFIFYWHPSFTVSAVSSNVGGVPSIIPMAIFGYWGFESCCTISHLIKGDKANASKAILIAFFATMAVYTLFHLGLLKIMGAGNLAANNVKDFVNFLTGPLYYIKPALALSVTVSFAMAFISSVFSIFTTTTATIHSMAEKNLFPKSELIQKLNANKRPHIAILLQGLVVFTIISLMSDIKLLTAIVNLGILTAFLLALIALFIYQNRNKQFTKIIVTLLAFVSWSIFAYYSWLGLGSTFRTKIFYALVLFVAEFIGLALYLSNKKAQTSR